MSLPDMMEWAKEHPDRAAIRIDELERENAALLKDVCDLVHKNELLREDKERLDWLCSTEGGRWAYWHLLGDDCVDRSVIDAARKKAQP